MRSIVVNLFAVLSACFASGAQAQTLYHATILGQSGSHYHAESNNAIEAASCAHHKCLKADDRMESYQISPEPPLEQGDWCVKCSNPPMQSSTCMLNANVASVLAAEEDCINSGGTITGSESGCENCFVGPPPPTVCYQPAACYQPTTCCQPKCCVSKKKRCRLLRWLTRRR